MIAVVSLAFAITFIACAITAYLLIQLIACLFLRRKLPPKDLSFRKPAAVLIPAHNEGEGLTPTLASVCAQVRRGDRVVVVADNCTDNTAQVARLFKGVEVVERSDRLNRGKSFAIAYGVEYLRQRPPATVIVLDADCIPSPGCIHHIASFSQLTNRPVQALNMMVAEGLESINRKIAHFAWVVKNRVRPSGADALGLPCQLMGTGMALPWKQITAIELKNGAIAEDLLMGLELARLGYPPQFTDKVSVWSHFAPGNAGVDTQRQRWEHGHLGVIFQHAPRLILEGIRRRNAALLALAFDVLVPPLALLCMLILATIVAIGLPTAPHYPILLMASGSVFALLTLALTGCWHRYERGVLKARELVAIPIYALRKIPLYRGFFRNKQSQWIRTERATPTEPSVGTSELLLDDLYAPESGKSRS